MVLRRPFGQPGAHVGGAHIGRVGDYGVEGARELAAELLHSL